LRTSSSVARNFVEGPGGHQWVRYTGFGDEHYILDVAQNMIGDARALAANPKTYWYYERPW